MRVTDLRLALAFENAGGLFDVYHNDRYVAAMSHWSSDWSTTITRTLKSASYPNVVAALKAICAYYNTEEYLAVS